MSVYSQVDKAEEAIRQALINALAEGDDQNLTDLFNLLSSIQTVKKDMNTIRFSEFNFNLNSNYLDRPGGDSPLPLQVDLDRPGGDLDALDNIEFSIDGPYAAGPVPIPGGLGEDVISFGDYKESRDD